jgi:hypothetical protein
MGFVDFRVGIMPGLTDVVNRLLEPRLRTRPKDVRFAQTAGNQADEETVHATIMLRYMFLRCGCMARISVSDQP